MEKKIVVITGANSGIGKAATIKFILEGYHVIMACRDVTRGRQARAEVIQRTNSYSLDLMEIEMSSFESIRNFCLEFKKRYKKLDILIHNAAYFNHGERYQLSPDHIELTFATNTFGPFLLTYLLRDHLKQSRDPRVLHASSNIVKQFFNPKRKLDFTDLQDKGKRGKRHSVYNKYCDSKMALLLLTFEMASKYKNEGIKVNALQINGARMSKETLKKFKVGWRMVARIQNLFFPDPSKMANAYFDICTSDEFLHITGELFNHKRAVMKPAKHNPKPIQSIKQLLGTEYYPVYAESKLARKQLWNRCLDLTSSDRKVS